MSCENEVTKAFIEYARMKLRDDFFPKIEQCAALLSEEDIWWRPNESSNSIGNVLLHLSGNLRQWIIHGVGGAEDTRDRPAEFACKGSIPKEELLDCLKNTLKEVDAVMAGLNPDRILEKRSIQGFDETCLSAIFHVTEHFAQHLGQISYFTKMKQDRDLGYFQLDDKGYSPK